ncbi:MAG: cytochrome c oxidase accessory protein CcoG, partial [Candidatus Rokuibacteriota bacterium]
QPAAERVLPTLNVDGTRRWLRPRLSNGRFLRRRRVVAGGLIGLFAALPHLRVGGAPAVLLDVVHRRFTLLGTTFHPTDTVLLMLLLVGIFLGIFLLTAVAGRVWCGWACPQTIYMEFVYRPIERLVERGASAVTRHAAWRRAVKAGAYLAVSMALAHTFLAYFVGVEALARWIRSSPAEHPLAFAVMAATTALMFLDFAYFREQVCMVACPYGRLQSVLLDRHSLIVAYDTRRGEPRGKPGHTTGDCIDCGACVATCPTGIDIRDGLQMECVHCTQCIDACDAIMDRLGRPRGLVRYGSRDDMAGAPRRLLRPRTVLYPALIAAVWGALAWGLAHRPAAEVTVLRGAGTPFAVLVSGEVSNQIRIKIENRGREERRYRLGLVEPTGLRLIAPENPLVVAGGHQATTTVFVIADRAGFERGERAVSFQIADGAGFELRAAYRLLGPTDAAAAGDRR